MALIDVTYKAYFTSRDSYDSVILISVRDDYRRRRLPIILPLTVTSLMSIVITSLTYVEDEIFLNIIFVLFTVYRSYLFSFEITFLNDM